MPEGLTAAALNILQHDDALVPPSLRSGMQQKLLLALSFGSTTDSSAAADCILVIYSSPLKFELYQGGVLMIVVNEKSLMHYEQMQNAVGNLKAAGVGKSDLERHGGKDVVDYGEDGE